MNPYRLSMCSRIFTEAFALSVTAPGFARVEEDTWNICSTLKTQYVLQIPARLIHSTAPIATEE